MSPLPASSPTMPVAACRAFPSGRCCVRRRFRVYTGSDRCKRMASSNNSHDLGNVDGAGVRVFRRKQDRLRAAAVTNEQREEKNRKHRESYNKRKCYANDKENVPVGNTNASDAGIISELFEDHIGERIVTVFKSDDKRIERNKNRREAYRMKKEITRNKSFYGSMFLYNV